MSPDGTAPGAGDPSRLWPSWLPDELRVRVEAAYAGTARGHHDRRHLAEVLGHLDVLTPPGDPVREAVVLAAWFHDVVYDPATSSSGGDDEERSAVLAESSLREAGAPDGLVAEVGRLVRLTRTHRPMPDDRAGELLCDADLAVLAAGPDRYAEYVAGVRAEYAHVDDAAFAAGRAAVLRDLLAKPTLFHTPAARDRWEQRARRNVEDEIRRLSGPADMLGP